MNSMSYPFLLKKGSCSIMFGVKKSIYNDNNIYMDLKLKLLLLYVK